MTSGLDRKIAEFVVKEVPPGSGVDARLEVMGALADVLGMYLAGDLAKLGRGAYKEHGQLLIDRMAGVAETSAIQLRPHGRPTLIGVERRPPEFTSPPADMDDPDGEKGRLLSAMAVVISSEELYLWDLPGWPAASVVPTKDGLRIGILPDESTGERGSVWEVRKLETEELS